jgi:hypothetical protein
VNPSKLALLHPDLRPTTVAGTPPAHAPVTASSPRRPAGTQGNEPAATATSSTTDNRAAPTNDLLVEYFDGKLDPMTNNPSPNLRIINNGSIPVALSALAARYYFTARQLDGQQQILDVDWASVGAGNVLGDFVHVAGDRYYLRIRFSPAAGQLGAHGGVAEIKMRIHTSRWSVYDQRTAYSFGPPTTYTAWPRVPLFAGTRLIWGVPEAP